MTEAEVSKSPEPSEVARLIKQCDDTLHLLRESWLDAKLDDKPKWMNRINIMLDERFRHMQTRDNHVPVPAVSSKL